VHKISESNFEDYWFDFILKCLHQEQANVRNV